jgi:NADH-quinone oxidoreductase subunit F
MLQNCDQCAPCREGLYRINEILQQIKEKPTEKEVKTLQEIFDVLEKTSLCPFGRTAYMPFKTALEKLF